MKRHRKQCRFYYLYGSRKFGDQCCYSHNVSITESSVILKQMEELKERIRLLEAMLQSMSKQEEKIVMKLDCSRKTVISVAGSCK